MQDQISKFKNIVTEFNKDTSKLNYQCMRTALVRAKYLLLIS